MLRTTSFEATCTIRYGIGDFIQVNFMQTQGRCVVNFSLQSSEIASSSGLWQADKKKQNDFKTMPPDGNRINNSTINNTVDVAK